MVGASGVTVRNNLITKVTGTGMGSGRGISCDNGNFSVGNTIVNASYGVLGGLYQNNLCYGCLTPFFSGKDGGGNVSQ